ncbi:hypothetical protein A2U01_0041325, partial [Trifolium medium]|nr:hypothetical protein [Trifolium medium]
GSRSRARSRLGQTQVQVPDAEYAEDEPEAPLQPLLEIWHFQTE